MPLDKKSALYQYITSKLAKSHPGVEFITSNATPLALPAVDTEVRVEPVAKRHYVYTVKRIPAPGIPGQVYAKAVYSPRRPVKREPDLELRPGGFLNRDSVGIFGDSNRCPTLDEYEGVPSDDEDLSDVQ